MGKSADGHIARRSVLQGGAAVAMGTAFGAVLAAETGNDALLLILLAEVDALDGDDAEGQQYAFPASPRWRELVNQIRATPAHTAAGRIGKARFVHRMLGPAPTDEDHPMHQIAWSLVNDVLTAEG